MRSGIADYSADLLPHLAALCDLRVVEVPGLPLADEVRARWQPVAAAATGEGGRLPLYQMGNNRYHEAVFELALERPGVVTLHDVVLHHLLVEATLGREDLETYGRRLTADHGWVGELTARARRWGELGQAALFGLPAHRGLVRRQRGVLVHSGWAAGMVSEADPEVEVRVVPMAVPLPPLPEGGAGFRERLGVAAETPLLGCFGFQTPIKRTERALAALARPELRAAHLVVAGEVSPALELEAEARRLGVADRVHFIGFVDYRRFEAAIAACDLGVNLRYPSAGETSASLLRVLALGRPAVVSDYGHTAELPAEVVVQAPVGEGEVERLAAEAGALLADRARLVAMSSACREYVARRHDPARAAAAMLAACAELAALEPPGEAASEPRAPSTLVWHRVPGELEVEGAAAPWPEGEARRLEIRLLNRGPARWLATRHKPGGVMVELHWRRSPWHPPVAARWLELQRDLEPGGERTFELEVRRPPRHALLVVEPHLQGVAGFNALAGPSWKTVF